MKIKGIILLVLGIVLSAVLSVWVVTLYRGHQALERARSLKVLGNNQAIMEAYHLAISWRSPFNPYPQVAFDELLALEAMLNDPKEKIEALLLLKSGLRSSRSFLTSSDDNSRVEDLDQRLNKLMQSEPSGGIKEVYPPRISYFGQGITQLMFWLWMAGVLHLIWRGFDKSGNIVKRGFLEGLVGSIVAYIGWIVSLVFA